MSNRKIYAFCNLRRTDDRVTCKVRVFSLAIVHHVHANFSPLNPLRWESESHS